MKGIFSLVATALKAGGRFLAGDAAFAIKNPYTLKLASKAMGAAKLNIGMGLAWGLLTPGTPHERLTNALTNASIGFMTMGMSSPFRQMGWSMALGMIPHFASMTKGVVRGYRSTLESRTSVAIPFSYSTVAMDQAFATLQYSRQRMSEAYQNVGSEAAFFAARYMSRG